MVERSRGGSEPACSNRKPPPLSVSGVGSGEALGESTEFGCGLCPRDARTQASDDGEPVRGARVAAGNAGRQLLKISERDPKLGVEDEVEAAKCRRSDADDGEGPAGKGD